MGAQFMLTRYILKLEEEYQTGSHFCSGACTTKIYLQAKLYAKMGLC